MYKTYSVALQRKDGIWFTNYHKYFNLDEIDWKAVEDFCVGQGRFIAYGYYYGTKSNTLTSPRCRTILKTL